MLFAKSMECPFEFDVHDLYQELAEVRGDFFNGSRIAFVGMRAHFSMGEEVAQRGGNHYRVMVVSLFKFQYPIFVCRTVQFCCKKIQELGSGVARSDKLGRFGVGMLGEMNIYLKKPEAIQVQKLFEGGVGKENLKEARIGAGGRLMIPIQFQALEGHSQPIPGMDAIDNGGTCLETHLPGSIVLASELLKKGKRAHTSY